MIGSVAVLMQYMTVTDGHPRDGKGRVSIGSSCKPSSNYRM